MIYRTQLIYIKEGQESIFDEFESIAIPLIRKHNGELVLRVRPNETSLIEGTMELPYEIHLVSFRNQDDCDNFVNDPERQKFLHLKEQSIKEEQKKDIHFKEGFSQLLGCILSLVINES